MAEMDKPTDRRRLLRRAGTLAAGVAGAGVAGAVAAPPAQAAAGDPVIMGEVNNAPGTTKLVVHIPDRAPLELSNTWDDMGMGPAGPALRLVPLGDELWDEAAAGSMSADRFGIPWVSVQHDGFTRSYRLQTSLNSNTTVPITPTRVVDTRNGAGRSRIINASVLDSAGRLPRNQTMHVNLSDLAFFPDAALLNATVSGQTTAGYLTVFAYPHARPGVSSLNYPPNQNLSNFVFTATGANEGNQVQAGISVFTSQLTHVVLDVVGFVVSSGAVNPAVLPAALSAIGGTTLTGDATKREQAIRKSRPAWK